MNTSVPPDASQNGTKPEAEDDDIQEDVDENPGKHKQSTGNPYMKAIKPGWYENPQPLDFIEGMMSDEFCVWKLAKTIVGPLDLPGKDLWMAVASAGWDLNEELKKQPAKEEAREMIAALLQDKLLRDAFNEEYPLLLDKVA